MRGNIRFLGTYYKSDSLKAIYYDTARITDLGDLMRQPFDFLGLRAEFKMPAVIIISNTDIPGGLRNAINSDRNYKQLIPKIHININSDGTMIEDAKFYTSFLNRQHIPDECKLIDWYRDIAYAGNGYLYERSGRTPSEANGILHKSSWMPTLFYADYELLSSAQTLCAHLQIYDPFDGYIGFFQKLMLIDWSKNVKGEYNTDYNHRLGLTDERARKLVLAFGLIWNSDPTASIKFICKQSEQWWIDFENSYNEYPESKKNQWARLAFSSMYQNMTKPNGLGDVHLLFNPNQFQDVYPEWTSHENIANDEDWSYWLYPKDKSIILPPLSYFPIHFLTDILKGEIFDGIGGPQREFMHIRQFLDRTWKRCHS